MEDQVARQKKEKIRKIVIAFSVYSFGYFLNIGSYLAITGLQSSVNIEASIGTISLGIAYVVSFLTALLLTPSVIRKFGCKYAFLIGEIAHLLYIVANFYPVKYVMIISGVIVGVGEGMIWTTVPVFSTFFGIQHGSHGSKHRSEYIRKYAGIFFGVYFAGQEKHKDHSVKATLIAIFKHSTNFMQILLLPALLYHGLMYGFYLGELVRAYTSCILGVEHVGLSLVAISISSAISSVLSGKLIGLLGRNITIAILLVGETLAYVFCLLWRPNEDSKSLVYAIFVVFGVTYSCWKMCIISMYTDYFPKNQEIAYTVWSIWILIGIAISFVWSPLLCVRAKLYVHCVVLLLSVSCYGVAEFFYKSNYQSRELNIEVEPDEKQLFQEKDEQ
ncbi:protein unc-93 homolog A-like isoform X3 [Styela clava]|uniref:protein unc-93 homolog A-like isoform X2 n=1 Tax=Styela clava TaxID=7725 RepID=UPI001939ABFE|nr:protein unc-93 homolog A-like isoform X2 [Styela clava]